MKNEICLRFLYCVLYALYRMYTNTLLQRLKVKYDKLKTYIKITVMGHSILFLSFYSCCEASQCQNKNRHHRLPLLPEIQSLDKFSTPCLLGFKRVKFSDIGLTNGCGAFRKYETEICKNLCL